MSNLINQGYNPEITYPSRHLSHDMYDALHPSFFDPTVEPDAHDPSPNQYRVIPTAHLFFERVVESIGQAEESVDLQFYTLEADHEVAKVMQASAEAAERGVQVRVRVDHLVSDPRRLFSTLRQNRTMNSLPNVSIRHMTTALASGAGQSVVLPIVTTKKLLPLMHSGREAMLLSEALISRLEICAGMTSWLKCTARLPA